MSDVLACRCCLITGSKLEPVSEVSKRIYKTVTGLDILKGDGYPCYICVECKSQIKKVLAFRRKCRRAFYVLKEIKIIKKEVTYDDVATVNRKKANLESTHGYWKSQNCGFFTLESPEIIEENGQESNEPSPVTNLKTDGDLKVFPPQVISDHTLLLVGIDSEETNVQHEETVNNFDNDVFDSADYDGEFPEESETKEEEPTEPAPDIDMNDVFKDLKEESKHSDSESEKEMDLEFNIPEKETKIKCSKKYKYFTHAKILLNSIVRRLSLEEQIFVYQRRLKTHNVSKFKCAVCSQYFDSEEDINKHILEYNESYKFSCTICKNRFETEKELQMHLNSEHLFEYTCRRCFKNFYTMQNRIDHELCHNKRSYYSCRVESAASVQQPQRKDAVKLRLIDHFDILKILKLRTTENDDSVTKKPPAGLITCKYCESGFSTKEELDKHMEGHYLYNYKCKTCNLLFQNVPRAVDHLFSKFHIKQRLKEMADSPMGEFKLEYPSNRTALDVNKVIKFMPGTKNIKVISFLNKKGTTVNTDKEILDKVTVTGKTLSSAEGKDAEIECGENTIIDTIVNSKSDAYRRIIDSVVDSASHGYGQIVDKSDADKRNTVEKDVYVKTDTDDEYIEDSALRVVKEVVIQAETDINMAADDNASEVDKEILDTKDDSASETEPVMVDKASVTDKKMTDYPSYKAKIKDGKPITGDVMPAAMEDAQDKPQNKTKITIEKKKFDKDRDCEFCFERFASKATLTKHRKLAHPRETLTAHCGQCGEGFFTEYIMYCHQFEEHGWFYAPLEVKKGPYRCDTCDVSFGSELAYKTHLAKMGHTDSPDYERSCELCRMYFETDDEMEKHKGWCQVPTKKCKYCKEAVRIPEYREHFLSRHQKETSLCPYCGDLVQKATAQFHLRMHQKCQDGDSALMQCKYCAARFRQADRYCRHIIVKHTVKPYQCVVCGLFFTYRYGVRDHILKTHAPELYFQCPQCPRQFAHENYLAGHCKQAHGVAAKITCGFKHKNSQHNNSLVIYPHVRIDLSLVEPEYLDKIKLYMCDYKNETMEPVADYREYVVTVEDFEKKMKENNEPANATQQMRKYTRYKKRIYEKSLAKAEEIEETVAKKPKKTTQDELDAAISSLMENESGDDEKYDNEEHSHSYYDIKGQHLSYCEDSDNQNIEIIDHYNVSGDFVNKDDDDSDNRCSFENTKENMMLPDNYVTDNNIANENVKSKENTYHALNSSQNFGNLKVTYGNIKTEDVMLGNLDNVKFETGCARTGYELSNVQYQNTARKRNYQNDAKYSITHDGNQPKHTEFVKSAPRVVGKQTSKVQNVNSVPKNVEKRSKTNLNIQKNITRSSFVQSEKINEELSHTEDSDGTTKNVEHLEIHSVGLEDASQTALTNDEINTDAGQIEELVVDENVQTVPESRLECNGVLMNDGSSISIGGNSYEVIVEDGERYVMIENQLYRVETD